MPVSLGPARRGACSLEVAFLGSRKLGQVGVMRAPGEPRLAPALPLEEVSQTARPDHCLRWEPCYQGGTQGPSLASTSGMPPLHPLLSPTPLPTSANVSRHCPVSPWRQTPGLRVALWGASVGIQPGSWTLASKLGVFPPPPPTRPRKSRALPLLGFPSPAVLQVLQASLRT